jgi:hypothetical protein
LHYDYDLLGLSGYLTVAEIKIVVNTSNIRPGRISEHLVIVRKAEGVASSVFGIILSEYSLFCRSHSDPDRRYAVTLLEEFYYFSQIGEPPSPDTCNCGLPKE